MYYFTVGLHNHSYLLALIYFGVSGQTASASPRPAPMGDNSRDGNIKDNKFLCGMSSNIVALRNGAYER